MSHPEPKFRWLTLLCLAVGTAPALAQDAVRLRNGKTESGRIESEGYDGIVLKAKVNNQDKQLKITWDQVAHVSYGGGTEYAQVVNQIASGNFGAAIPRLTAMAQNANLRKELKPHVLYQLGVAQQRAGKLAEASTAFVELVKAFPRTQYLSAAAAGIVECQIRAGDIPAGTAALTSLIESAQTAGVGPDYLGAFDFYRGRLLEAQKNITMARGKYQAAATARGGPPALVAAAQLGIARCEQAEGNLVMARNAYKSLLDLDAGNEVLAGAWNGLADMAKEEATKTKKADKLLDSLFMYLRGVVEFAPAPGEGTGEYERALAGAASVFKLLSDSEADETRKKQYAQQAKQRLDQLKKEFPTSRYLEGT
jgi:outer membrane protein assembly factor BamD (BamD/ComL family)